MGLSFASGRKPKHRTRGAVTVIGRDGGRFGVADDRVIVRKAELPAVALGKLPRHPCR
jgi:hypothetical protein